MAFKNKVNKSDTPKTANKTPRKKMSKRSIVNAICIVFLSVCVIGSTIAFVLIQNILSSSEIMDKLDGLYSESSSELYDRDSGLITTLAREDGVRENIAYDEIPQVVIDSFLAVEDSRYFKHSGFDLPRFIKSGWVNITSGGIAQGGSTLTMQLVDVKLFPDASATNQSLVEKLEQKVVEIFKSMDIESRLNKEQVLEYYLNSINFGGPARGIQKGAQYYFGKDAKNLNLSEAAFLAGVINAPGINNPYNVNINPEMTTYLERATKRRDDVLYYLNYHGYISETEYKLALSTDLSLQLNGETSFNTDAYASFIKLVVDEVREKTGLDPYTTPMKIYTTMDKDAQELSDSILNGEVVTFPDERIQTGFSAINNQTGEILAIGGGRGYTLDSNYNHGAYFEHQIGSTAKPIIEYTQAFEYLGYSTEHVFEDTPVNNYTSDGGTLYNADRQFHGDVTFKDAVGWSYNLPAYKTLLEVTKEIGIDGEVELLNKMGIDQITKDNFTYGISIGGSELAMTPLQLSAAYGVLANKGTYIEPYSVSRIVFEDSDKEDYIAEAEKENVFSDESAYLMSYLLRNNITQKYPTITSALSSAPYPVYAKSGTSDAPGGLAIPEGVAKDKWIAAYTNQYTVSTWLGYEDYTTNPNNYLNENVVNAGYPEAITRALLDSLTDGSAQEIERPSGVTSISHVQGVFPYASSSSGKMVSGLIRSKFAKVSGTISPDPLESLSSFDVKLDNNVLSLAFTAYSDQSALSGTASKTVSAGGASVTYTPLFSKYALFGAVRYKYEVYINGTLIDTYSDSSEKVTKQISTSNGDEVRVCGFYGYEKDDTTSNKICKTVTSSGVSSSFKVGTDFDALFATTTSYEDAVAAVTAWANANLPGVNISFVRSENIEAGKNDTSRTTIKSGSTVSSDKTYTVAIGTKE